MTRSRRTKIEPNIYEDAYGLAAKVQVGLLTREERWPPATPLKTIRQWVGRTRAELAEQQPREKRGTLKADAERYYKRIAHLASWRERRSEIRAWVARYGEWPRAKITRKDILESRAVWLAAGKAPKTCNHRVAALAHLYRELDGKVPTPCDDIEPLEVPKQPPIAVSLQIIRTVYRQLLAHERRGLLRDAKTRARFMVLAASGVRASELMRVQPSDVDLEQRIWRTRDGKGGVRPGGLYLYDDLLEAWQVFVEAGAWGPFETSSMARVLHHCGWPTTIRPYTLRHAVGIALSEGGTDLSDIGAWLGHAEIGTTRRHYVPILAGRMRAVGESLGQRIGWPTEPDSGALSQGTDARVMKSEA